MGCSCNMGIHNQPCKISDIKGFNITANDLVTKKIGSINKDYDIIRPPIGKGSFGKVYRAIHKVSGEERAVKVIRENKENQEKIIKEVSILKQLDHPNILKIYEFYQDDNYISIVTELCTGGELFDKISSEHQFSEIQAAYTIRQVLSAISYCHKNQIVHRDLKPENLLLDNKETNALIKLVDFGTSDIIRGKMIQVLGTPYYVAPEVLNENYTEKCDVWSCGVILYTILCGYPPFQGESESDIIEKVKRGKFSFQDNVWRRISAEAKDLITKLLTKDPNLRCSAAQALEHQWINQNNVEIDVSLLQQIVQNLRTYKVSSKLQEAFWIYMVNHLSNQKEKTTILNAFQALDLNHDGLLSKEELITAFSKLMNISEAQEEVFRIMKVIDKNNSQLIDYTEFLMASMNRNEFLNDQKIEKAFHMFHKEEIGGITKEEICMILGGSKSYDEKIWNHLIKDVDLNGDGEIQMQEFKDMMKWMVHTQ